MGEITNHRIVSHEQWITERKTLLAKEKEFNRLRDQLSAQRRDLPWERVTKQYVFSTPHGAETLEQLFDGRSQLVVYHAMFDPKTVTDKTPYTKDAACPTCSFWMDNIERIVVHLAHRDVTLIAASRAPVEKLEAYRKRMGWTFKWVSVGDGDFNRDYGVTLTAEEIANGTGEYNYAQQIRPDQVDRIKSQPAIEAQIAKPYGWITAVPNHKEGIMANKKIRQAFLAVLDMEPIRAAGIGNKAFYRLDGALFYPEQVAWYSDAALASYNQKNKAKARQLLKEAGYSGQPVRWVTTKEYDWMYTTALMASQQMEEVGFKVDLQVVDWATLVQRRNKPELFDIFSTGFTLGADPAIATSVQCNWPGWWCNEEKDKLLAEMAREPDAKKRKALIDKVQTIFYDDVGRIKFGDYFNLDVTRKEVRGFKPGPYLYFWNTWIAGK